MRPVPPVQKLLFLTVEGKGRRHRAMAADPLKPTDLAEMFAEKFTKITKQIRMRLKNAFIRYVENEVPKTQKEYQDLRDLILTHVEEDTNTVIPSGEALDNMIKNTIDNAKARKAADTQKAENAKAQEAADAQKAENAKAQEKAAAEAAEKRAMEEKQLQADAKEHQEWAKKHEDNGVAPFLLASTHRWMNVGYVLGLEYPSQLEDAKQKAAAFRFMQEGVYDTLDVVVEVMTRLQDLATTEIEIRIGMDIFPLTEFTSEDAKSVLTFMESLRDAFHESRHAYVVGKPELLLSKGLPVKIENARYVSKLNDKVMREIIGMTGTDPDVMFGEVWGRLGTTWDGNPKARMPETWTRVLAALQAHAKAMYLMCTAFSIKSKGGKFLDKSDEGTIQWPHDTISSRMWPRGAMTKETDEEKATEDEEKATDEEKITTTDEKQKVSIIKAIREAVWLMGLLWNTGGFDSGQDMTVANRKKAYQAWAGTPKESGPGMQRTLGALYYAALTTLARQAGPGTGAAAN